jgi:cytochrome c biogenesis protein ResB
MPDSSIQISNPSFLLFAALVLALVLLCGRYGFQGVWKLLRNVKFAVAEIALISLFTIIGSTIPQGKDPQIYTRLYGQTLGRLIVSFGFNDVFYTLWFNFLLILLCTSVLACLSHRYRPTWRMFGFLITHAGLLLIAVGALATGLFGFRGEMILHEGESASQFLRTVRGRIIPEPLPFAVTCERFWIDHYDKGNGDLIVYKPNKLYEKHMRADPGNSLYSEANNATIRVVEIFPDFAMDHSQNRPTTRSNKWRNPATLVEVERDGLTEQEILFYLEPTLRINPKLQDVFMRYSRDPQSLNIKCYNSTLRVVDDGRVKKQKTIVVNDPLRYKGYSFYQNNWDQERESYTVLEVKKDPGEEIFYFGGAMVMMGVVVIFYVNPLLRRRLTHRQSDGA